MKTKCPACGAVNSLDSLLAHDGAREAILACASLSGELGVWMIRYIALFRPKVTELTFSRVATLINQLLPDIKSQRIQRDGKVFEAPTEAWIYAMEIMVTKRSETVKLPIRSHGYLYEIIAGYKPETSLSEMPQSNTPPPPQTKKGSLVGYLQSKKR